MIDNQGRCPRFVAYRAGLAIVLVALALLGSDARMWRSAGAPPAAGGTLDESRRVVDGEGSGADSSVTTQKPVGAASGDERPEAAGDAEPGAGRSAESMRVRATVSGPAVRAPLGWPGLTEAELRFGSEAEDPQWARPAETRLLSMISELDELALGRLEAECRESMCRLLLIYPPGGEPIYTIRQIYDRIAEIGLGPMLAETEVEAGELKTLRLFLRRRNESRR